MSLFEASLIPALDADGDTLSGAVWNFYASGTNTPVSVFSDAELTTPLGSSVEADGSGRFPAIYLNDNDPIRAVLRDASGVAVPRSDIDPVNASTLTGLAGVGVTLTGDGDVPPNINVFEITDPNRKARYLFKPANRGAHIGELFASWGVEFRPSGSGANGPSNADVGMVISVIKPTSAVGELDGGYMYVKQDGPLSDVCGWLVQVDRKGGTGFSAQHEGTTRDVDPATGNVLKEVRCQFGVLDSVTGDSIGYYVNAQADVMRYGMLMRSSPGLFENYITCIFGSNPLPVFNVDGQGRMDIRKGGLRDSLGLDQIVSAHFAATGGFGFGEGNSLQMIHEYRHYTTPVDWRTSEYRLRFSVDGVSATDTWISFRGKAGPESTSIAFGFGYSGAPAFEVKREGGVKIAGLVARDYADDTAAAAAGIEVGELYNTGGAVKVRRT